MYQKSTIIPTLSVAENLFLNRQSHNGPISWRGMRKRAGELLDAYELDIDPKGMAEDLSVEQLQLVEIARALSHGARFVILDEPTAQLEGKAIERLFTRMRALRESGVTFLFISHHLQEVFDACDVVTVFRDAQHVLTTPVKDITPPQLVEAMTGEAAGEAAGNNRPPAEADAEVVLAAREAEPARRVRDMDLAVRAGEVVGLAGVGGSGKVALAETLVGLRKAASGTVEITGRPANRAACPAALAAGLGFVPQDRHKQGLVPLLSVAENATLTIADRFGRWWLHQSEAAQGGGQGGHRRTGHQDRRTGSTGLRPFRRQRAEGGDGAGAGQQAQGAGADQPDRRRRRALARFAARKRWTRRRAGAPGCWWCPTRSRTCGSVTG